MSQRASGTTASSGVASAGWRSGKPDSAPGHLAVGCGVALVADDRVAARPADDGVARAVADDQPVAAWAAYSRSRPAPPTSRSFPASPYRRSLPAPPDKRSDLAVPRSVSGPLVPVTLTANADETGTRPIATATAAVLGSRIPPPQSPPRACCHPERGRRASCWAPLVPARSSCAWTAKVSLRPSTLRRRAVVETRAPTGEAARWRRSKLVPTVACPRSSACGRAHIPGASGAVV